MLACLLIVLSGTRFGVAQISVPGTEGGFPSARVAFPVNPVLFPSAPVRFESRRLAAPQAGARDELRFSLTSDVLFDFGKADLRREAEVVLRDLTAQMRQRFPRAIAIRVEGHTDSIGTDEYNDALSLRRAESVQRWLMQVGNFPASATRTQGFGRRRPVAPNQLPNGADNPDGRQRNRRVELVAQAPGSR